MKPFVTMKTRKPAWLVGLIMISGLLGAVCCGRCDEADSRTKALDLLNFAQYVDWPKESFASTNKIFTIGVVGAEGFADVLKDAALGKNVSDRSITVQQLTNRNDWRKCQILFIGQSDQKRLAEILGQVRNRSILTVSENAPAARQGNIVNFTKTGDKVSFEIDLAAAHQAKLQIHSKLLTLADKVKGKP
jgi:hypothetical protein